MKELDGKCLLCMNYDICPSDSSSKDCKSYEFYKCQTCVDKVVENDQVPRCFRGGQPCSQIYHCTVSKE